MLHSPSHVHVVLEYGGADLHALIAAHLPGRVREGVARSVIAGAAAALAHCHGCGVAHRDVKPENICVSVCAAAPSAPRGECLAVRAVRLIDFGLCALDDDDDDDDDADGRDGGGGDGRGARRQKRARGRGRAGAAAAPTGGAVPLLCDLWMPRGAARGGAEAGAGFDEAGDDDGAAGRRGRRRPRGRGRAPRTRRGGARRARLARARLRRVARLRRARGAPAGRAREPEYDPTKADAWSLGAVALEMLAGPEYFDDVWLHAYQEPAGARFDDALADALGALARARARRGDAPTSPAGVAALDADAAALWPSAAARELTMALLDDEPARRCDVKQALSLEWLLGRAPVGDDAEDAPPESEPRMIVA